MAPDLWGHTLGSLVSFFKWANPGFFVYFHYFLDTITIIQIEKSIDGVLGIQTRGRRMVGADETMELWWPPKQTHKVEGANLFIYYLQILIYVCYFYFIRLSSINLDD